MFGSIIPILGLVLVAFIVGYWARKYIAEAKIASAEEAAKRILEQAEKEGEAKKREITLEAKEEVHKLRADQEREYRERRNELQRMERRVVQKEEALDRKMELLEKKENELVSREADVQRIKEELEELYRKQLAELERLSGLSSEEAKNILLTNIEKEIRHEAAMMIKEIESQAKEEAEKRAKKHIALAIQR
ncbi:MAG: Rnase Y domain-containing protein, partial [bacterium]